MATSDYGQSSISSLKGADRVRKRPGVIFGSANIDGAIHAVFEIVSNSVDEAKEGYGDVINIDIREDGAVRVEDFGRGIPLDWNPKEERFNWELVFCELYAGGKYDESEGGNYGDAIGLNGLGACATQCASEYMNVTVYKDGTKYEIQFKEGNPVTELIKSKTDRNYNGSIIEFKLDLNVFDEIKVPIETMIDMLRRQAMLNAGLKFNLNYAGHGEITFNYPEGTSEFIKEIVGKDKLTKEIITGNNSRVGRDDEKKPEYTVNMDVAMSFSRHHQLIELYHNSSPLENGGMHLKALKEGLVKAFNDLIKNNKEHKNIGKITYQDIEDILVCIISTKSLGSLVQYENQTKKAVNNKFIYVALKDYLYDFIMQWSVLNETECFKVIKEIGINKNARESAEAIKSKAIKKLTSNIDNNTKRPNKFVDCDSKNVEEKELFIVEGDSALGSCVLARNADFQALMPLRGKIRNCLKSSLLEIMKSDPIMDLITVLGCGIDTSDKNFKGVIKFDLSKLRWGKIIICTDADIDGMQIRTLVLTMFYRLMPEVLKAGKVYIAETPLYEITYRGNTYFAYNEDEKTKIFEELGNPKTGITIQRSKGLGENEPEMMSLTTMAPDTRRLVQVKYEECERNHFMFNALLGDDLENRRALITEYAATVDAYTILD